MRKPYEQARDSEVNLLFAAAILRTTDLLHVNSERTPDVDFEIISLKIVIVGENGLNKEQ